MTIKLIGLEEVEEKRERPKQIEIKKREIPIYPELTEKSITPEGYCCKQVCPIINDLIDKTLRDIRKSEAMIKFGMKGVSYTDKIHEMDTLLRIRTRFKYKKVCTCYE